MQIVEKIDFTPGCGKHNVAIQLLSNQLLISQTEDTKNIFLNAVVNFLKKSIINDIMQIQPVSKKQDTIKFMYVSNDSNTSFSLQTDDIVVETDNESVCQITLDFLDTLQQDKTPQHNLHDTFSVLYESIENKMLCEIVDRAEKFTFVDDVDIKIFGIIQNEANNIGRKNRRGTANVIVISSKTFSNFKILDVEKKFLNCKDDGSFYINQNIKIRIHEAIGDKILLAYNNVGNTIKIMADGGGYFIPYIMFDLEKIEKIESTNNTLSLVNVVSDYTTFFHEPKNYYTVLTIQ